MHIAYCPAGQAVLRLNDKEHALPANHGLRVEDMDSVAVCHAGRIVLGSVLCV